MFCHHTRNACLLIGLVLLTATRPLSAGESELGRGLRHELSNTVDFKGIEDARATLNDFLDAFSKRYNLAFDVNVEAFNEAGLKEDVGRTEIAQPTPIPEMRTTLRRILLKVLRRVPYSAAYFIRGDVIEITTTEAIRKEFFADRPSSPGPLPPLVSGAFDKITLESVLKELNDYGNIVLDARTGKEAQVPVTADLANVPLDTAVRMFADMAGLKVVPLDNALYVTSKDNARALLKEQEKLRLQQREQAKKEKDDKADEKEKKPATKPASPKAEAPSGKKST